MDYKLAKIYLLHPNGQICSNMVALYYLYGAMPSLGGARKPNQTWFCLAAYQTNRSHKFFNQIAISGEFFFLDCFFNFQLDHQK